MNPQNIFNDTGDVIGKTTAGIDQIYLYNNIAITVLTVMCLFLIAGNFYQYWASNRRRDRDFDRYMTVATALAGVREILVVIKEKIYDEHD